MGLITVRLIETEADREALYAFRYRVYVEELGLTNHADHDRKWLCDEYDEQSISFAVFEDDEIVGSLRCILLDRVRDRTPLVETFAMTPALKKFGAQAIAATSRFMITPRLRNTRAAYKLMREAFAEGQRRGIRLSFGDCSPHLLPFYEQLGYRRYTDGYNDPAFGYKLPIVMVMGDRIYMERVRSPLAEMVAETDDAETRAWFEETYPTFVVPRSAPFMPEDAFFAILEECLAGDPLHALRLLRGLGRVEADQLLARATVITARPGHLIIREGEWDDTLYVVLSGVVEVRVGKTPGELVAVRGAGDSFGELEFLTKEPRQATVAARTDAEILVLSGEYMERFIQTEPVIGAKVLHNLAKELAGRLAEKAKESAIGA